MSYNCPKCSYTNTLAELQVAVEEIQQKLALNNNNKPLSPTEFKCIDTKGEFVILDSKEIPAGTLIAYGDSDYYKREAFRALVCNEDDKPWVLYTNVKLTHEQFAEMMNSRTNPPRILYWGL